MRQVVTAFIACSLMLLASSASAGLEKSLALQVELVRHWKEASTYVRFTPRHSVTGENCTADDWLILSRESASFDVFLSLLLAAQLSGQHVDVHFDQSSDSRYCEIIALTLKN